MSTIDATGGPHDPVNGSDAVFAAVAAATWLAHGCPPVVAHWPTVALMATPVGPYTPVVRAGDWLIVSGQIGIVDGKLVSGWHAARAEQAMRNLAGHLDANGASLGHVAKTTVFLRHMSDYAVMNEIYVAAFGDHRPARSAIGVADLPLGALVEVEAWAFVGAG